MNLHLAIPDLLWPIREDRAVLEGLTLPALETLLARGRLQARESAYPEQWLMSAYGAETGSAPFALLAEGGEAEQAVWLRADPCHLHVNRDKLILTDAHTFELEREEAEALVESLNRHFAEDGMTFYPMQPERWYVRLNDVPSIRTTPLDAARGRDIDPLLPEGEAAKHWRHLLNEVQMLLHDHPVNEAREARGAPAVNTVWFWGAGRHEALSRRPYNRVRARDPLAAGLAQSSGASILPLPDDAAQWLPNAPADGVELMVLESLVAPAGYGNAYEWRTRLEALEREWFAPLLAALRSGRIGMLTIHALGGGMNFDAETTRQDLRYFWRRAKPLSHYAE